MTDPTKGIPGTQLYQTTSSLAAELVSFLPFGGMTAPLVEGVISDNFYRGTHFNNSITPDAARLAKSALAEQYSIYVPAINSNADLLTKQDQEDIEVD